MADRATSSVKAVRGFSELQAKAAVKGVFERCYNDLEPFGRRVARSRSDEALAHDEILRQHVHRKKER